jgi:hypothetical protein
MGAGGAIHSTTGTISGITPTITSEWTQTPRMNIANTAGITSIAALYRTVATHFISQTTSQQMSAITSVFWGVTDASLLAGARMFAGDTSSIAAPTDIDPRTMTNCIGLVQSPTAALPNNLYFMINGSSATPYMIDTGITVALGAGYKFSIFYTKNSRVVGLRLSEINTDAVFEQSIDISTLAATNQPTTGSYSSRIWRTNNNNIATSNIAIGFAHMYLELKN